MKNFWLDKAKMEKKVIGKFQEAAKINTGRMYPHTPLPAAPKISKPKTSKP